MLKMYDAIGDMPGDADIYAGYVDGRWPTFASLPAKYPGKHYVAITVFGAPNVKVCDCETGDLTPAQAAQWAKSEIAAGRRPTIYCNTSTHVEAAAELLGLGLAFVRDVDWWEAHYDGIPNLSPGSVAKQYQSTDTLDISIVDPSWIGQPTPPKPPPPPTLYSPVPPPLALLIGGSAMEALDKMDMLIGTVNWAYFEYLGRLADPGGEKTYVTMLNEKGITAVIKSLATSTEGKAYQAAKRKSLGL